MPRAGSVHKVDAGSSKSPEDDGYVLGCGRVIAYSCVHIADSNEELMG